MTIFATDPAESGAVFAPEIVETAVLPYRGPGETTHNLAPYATAAPALRRASGELRILEDRIPATIGVVDGPSFKPGSPGTPPPMPPPMPPPTPPKPGWMDDAAEWPAVAPEAVELEVVKPLFRRGRHRRPVDWPDLVGTLALTAAGGYVGASAAQMWPVTW